MGRNRVFQSSELGSCICASGYEYIDNGRHLSEEDGTADCQPLVYPRCLVGDARDNTGRCVSDTGASCPTNCKGSPGRFFVSLGVCECDNTPDLDRVCDKTCRAGVPSIRYVNTGNGAKQLVIKGATATTVVDVTTGNDFYSSVDCALDQPCPLVPLVTSNGIGGAYGVPPALATLANAASEPEFELMSNELRLQTVSPVGAASVINPAIVCLQLGEGLLFDMSASNESYPVYLKDNLLNSNANFDYGAFRAVARKAQSAGLKLFAYTFDTPGTYVFSDNANPNQITVVAVQKVQTACPLEARIVPFTAANLVALGVVRNTDIILTPDWILVAIMGALIVLVFGGLILSIYSFKRSGWAGGHGVQAAYRLAASDRRNKVWQDNSKGSIMKVEKDVVCTVRACAHAARRRRLTLGWAGPRRGGARRGRDGGAGVQGRRH